MISLLKFMFTKNNKKKIQIEININVEKLHTASR